MVDEPKPPAPVPGPGDLPATIPQLEARLAALEKELRDAREAVKAGAPQEEVKTLKAEIGALKVKLEKLEAAEEQTAAEEGWPW